jgi:hypothetical protein
MESLVRPLVVSVLLVGAMIGAIAFGWHWGEDESRRGIPANRGLEALQSSVYGLLGLLLAFTFSAAQTRLEWQRQLLVQEGNDLGTAYLRLDALREKDRLPLRAKMARYARARLEVYAHLEDEAATGRAIAAAAAVGREIWEGAADGCGGGRYTGSCLLVLPALNAMLDTASARSEALESRLPKPIVYLLYALAVLSSLLAGYSMSEHRSVSRPHSILYILAVTLTIIVIMDLDHPRIGAIGLSQAEHRVLENVLRSMAASGR